MNKCENQTEERFNLLEIKIAYLEDFINKLQDVTLKQDKTLQQIEMRQIALLIFNPVCKYEIGKRSFFPSIRSIAIES